MLSFWVHAPLLLALIRPCFCISGIYGDLVLAHFSYEAYSSGGLQTSYQFPYRNNCTTWNSIDVNSLNVTSPKAAIYSSSRQNEVVIVFKGTITTEDWFNNADIFLDPCGIGPTECGWIHSGFVDYYSALSGWVRSAILAHFKNEGLNQEKKRLYLTGHSMGGAIAMLCAFDMSFYFPDLFASISVVTFGQPRGADDGFAQSFWQRNISYTRYVNKKGHTEDLFTTLPFSSLGYVHLNRATVLDCSTCEDVRGITSSSQLHSMSLYVSNLKRESNTQKVCTNGCASYSQQMSLAGYTVLPSQVGCSVLDGAKLNITVATLSGDQISVCLFSQWSALPSRYEYKYGISCGEGAVALSSQSAETVQLTNNSIAAGTYAVIIENHNAWFDANVRYFISFTNGIVPPQPPLMMPVVESLEREDAAVISWAPPSDFGTAELLYYFIYWGPVEGEQQTTNASKSVTSEQVRGLVPNMTYSFVMSASNGVESDFSNVVFYTYIRKQIEGLPTPTTFSPPLLRIQDQTHGSTSGQILLMVGFCLVSAGYLLLKVWRKRMTMLRKHVSWGRLHTV